MISTEQVQDIATKIGGVGIGEDAVMMLRQQYPRLHFTYCMDDDITTYQPVIEQETFNLYLIDGRDHCLCLTSDYQIATGIVVAEVFLSN
jgi:hypothetical protein